MGVETLLLSLPNVGLKVSGTGQRTEDVGSWEVPAASPGVRGTVQQGSPPSPPALPAFSGPPVTGRALQVPSQPLGGATSKVRFLSKACVPSLLVQHLMLALATCPGEYTEKRVCPG